MKNKPFATYTLEAGAHEGRVVFASLTFEGQPLRSVSLTFALEGGSGAVGDSPRSLAATKSVHDAWLARWLGRPTPSATAIPSSCCRGVRSGPASTPARGSASITVRYR